MKTISELQAIRDRMKAELSNRDVHSEDIRIVVGMATCGIASGARAVMSAFMNEITVRGLKNVKVSQTGCIGFCRLEPIAEIYFPGKDKITYVELTPDKVKRIVSEHIINGRAVIEYIYQPAK